MKKVIYLCLSILLLASCNNKTKTIDVNVMSFNIRYDNPEDSLNNWQYRKDNAAQIIKDKKVDILGAQEVLVNQLNDLKERLPEYNAIGVGREDGIDKGEYSAIFYNKNRFSENKSGYFWLSETPEVAGSKGWDGACERIATWAILTDKETKKEIFVLNTHLDHVGKIARQEGVTLLLNKVAELSNGLPVVVTGDFNSDPESDVIKHVTNEGDTKHLINAKSIAIATQGEQWTFHDFDRLPIENREFIDYIFVNKGVEVTTFEVIPAKLNDGFLSDHCPIFAQIKIK